MILTVILLTMWVLTRLRGAFIDGLGHKIGEAAEKHRELLGEENKETAACESFDESCMVKKLLVKLRDAAPPGARFINAREISESDLPALAPAGVLVYGNRNIASALLIITYLKQNRFLYSLAMQYLSVALPPKAWKFYSLILSDNCPVKMIRKYAGQD